MSNAQLFLEHFAFLEPTTLSNNHHHNNNNSNHSSAAVVAVTNGNNRRSNRTGTRNSTLPLKMSTPPTSSGTPKSNRPKFQCQLCASTFSRKDNLKTHQRLHSGEMPFQCKYCGRKFRWQSSARTHEQVHERHGHQPRPELAAAAEAARNTPAPRVKVESVVHAYSVPIPTSTVSRTYATAPPPALPYPPTIAGPSTAPSSLPLSYGAPQPPPPPPPPQHPVPSTYASMYSNGQSTTISALPPPLPTSSLYTTTSTTSTTPLGSYPSTNTLLSSHPPPLYTAAVTRPHYPLHPLPARAYQTNTGVGSVPAPPTTATPTSPPVPRLVRPHRRMGVERTIRKPRGAAGSAAAGLLSLDFEEVMGDVGAALQSSITNETTQTPQQHHGESPMFNLPDMSQQDIEKCLENPNQPPSSTHQ